MSIEHIKDLKADPHNARVHTDRNIGTIADGMQKVGAARSIVIDEEGVVLAGNGAVEAAAQVGITKVRVIEADGNEIIAVRRTGLTKKQKKLLALYDNRSNELSEWNTGIIKELANDGLDLHGLWSDKELSLLGDIRLEGGLDEDGEEKEAKAKSPQPEPVNEEESKENFTLWFTGADASLFLRLLQRVSADSGEMDMSRAVLWALRTHYGE